MNILLKYLFYQHIPDMKHFFWKKNKNRFLEHVKSIFYINWWIDRICLGLLSSVMKALYHICLRFFYYKSKILALLQTLIKPSQHHQKLKKLISRTYEKGFLWKLVGLSKMLPVTFQHNMTQINRCKKKLFFLTTKNTSKY